MSKAKYPDNFVVESDTGFVWDVTKVPGTDTWSWQERATHGGPIGPYTARFMDDQTHCEFIFPEPELVFPFTYKHKDGSCGGIVSKVANKGIAFDFDDDEDTYYNHWTIEQTKEFIKSGTWIVTSVGEPKYELSNTEGAYNPSKAIGTYTLKVDTKEALEAVKELTEALTNLEVVYKRVKVLFNE